MAGLEEIYHHQMVVDFAVIQKKCNRFSPPYVVPLEQIPDDATELVGRKALNLAGAGTRSTPDPDGSITADGVVGVVE